MSSVTQDFFSKLDGAQISLPSFLKEALICEGFDDEASFGALKEKSMQDFYQAIESQIKRLVRKSANEPANEIASEALMYMRRTLDTDDAEQFRLSMGFKNKLQSIREMCIQKRNTAIAQETVKQQMSQHPSAAAPKPKIDDKALKRREKQLLKAYNKNVRDGFKLDEEDDELKIVAEDGDYMAECPLCTKKMKIYEHLRGQFNIANFITHIKRHKGASNATIFESEDDEITHDSDNLNETNDNLNVSMISAGGDNGTSSSEHEINESAVESAVAKKPPSKKRKIGSGETSVTRSPRRTRNTYTDDMPEMMKMLNENCQLIRDHSTGNRYTADIKNLSAFFLIRFGLKQYEFIAANMRLPHHNTIRHHIQQSMRKLREGEIDFDGLQSYLRDNNYDPTVAIFEDGTKIVEKVEYDRETNSLSGLVAPLQANRMPIVEHFKAETAKSISDAVHCNRKAAYVQVILAQPNATGAQPYLLCFYGTDNRFTQDDVFMRNQYIVNELKKRGIRVLACGSDGDSRMLAAQKRAINFGTFSRFGPIDLCGDIDSPYFGHQDMEHILKRMKNILYGLSNVLIMGCFAASVNHLIILVKSFPKSLHGLVPSDLDVTDKLDYKAIDKITKPCVIDALKLMEGTDGTIAYLELMCKLRTAFVDKEVPSRKRIECASFAVQFVRTWKQWQINRRLNNNHMISINCIEGIEMDYVMLLELTLELIEQDISELSSQKCEEQFRRIRAFTSTECTVVNFTMKAFQSRVSHIMHADKLMQSMKDRITFPRATMSSSTQRQKSNITFDEIIAAVTEGMEQATQKCKTLGMECNNINLSDFLKPPKTGEISLIESEDTEDIPVGEDVGHEEGIREDESDNANEPSYVLYDFEFSDVPSDDGFLVAIKG